MSGQGARLWRRPPLGLLLAAAIDESMEIKVRLTGTIRALLKEGETTVALPNGATLGELLTALVDRYGEAFGNRLLRKDGTVQPSVRIFVNNELVGGSDHGAKPIASGEKAEVTVIFLPAVAGG